MIGEQRSEEHQQAAVQYAQARESKEDIKYSEVAIGYCQPFADPDQIMAYCFQRMAGKVADDAAIRFNVGKAGEDDFGNPSVLTLEATKDTTQGDPEQGNFTHQIVDDREVCAGYASFKAVEAELAEVMPDKIEALRRMADYIQTLELGRFEGGIQQPSLTQLFKGAQLAHLVHSALQERFDITETDQRQALEECFELFQLVVDTKQDAFETIDIAAHDDDTEEAQAVKERAQRFFEIAEFQRQHDRELLKDAHPQVRQLPSGVQIGYLDLRGKPLILGEGGMGIGYRKSDPETGHKADVLILDADAPAVDGGSQHKILVGVNTRNKHAREKGLDLSTIAADWNNLEYVHGVGAAALKEDNEVGGHHGDESYEIVTFLGAPAETGTGLDAQELQRALDEYFRVPRYSESQLREFVHLLPRPLPGAWIETVPAPYPNQHLRERAMVSCALSPENSPHKDHICTTCRREIRESELAVEQNEQEIVSVRQMTGRELGTRSYDAFEHFVEAGDARNALFELARGRVDLADYEGQMGEVLLPLFEQIARSEEAIDLIYNAQNETFNPLPDSEGYLPWSNQEADVRVSKYQLPGSVPFMIDSQLQQTLYEHVSSNADEQAQERFVNALVSIFNSSAYRNSRVEGQIYDHVGIDLLRIAANQAVRTSDRQDQTEVMATFSSDTQSRVQETLREAITQAETDYLHAYLRRARVKGEQEFVEKSRELVPHSGSEDEQQHNVLEVTRQETGHVAQKHLAIVIGRQQTNDGADIVSVVESGVMSADVVLQSEGLLRQEDFIDAEQQVLRQVEAMVEQMIEELPANIQGELDITVQGPQSIAFLLGQQLSHLKQEYGTLITFKFHQWRNGKFEEMPQL